MRKAICEDLRELRTAMGDRVFANRTKPYWEDGLPGCSVYTLNMDKELVQAAPRRWKRTLELVVEISLSARPPATAPAVEPASEGVDDPLDQLADVVERYLERERRLGGLVDDVRHKRQTYDAPGQGQERYGFLRLFEEVVWHTDAGDDPEGGLDPLRTVTLEAPAAPRGDPGELARVVLGPG